MSSFQSSALRLLALLGREYFLDDLAQPFVRDRGLQIDELRHAQKYSANAKSKRSNFVSSFTSVAFDR